MTIQCKMVDLSGSGEGLRLTQPGDMWFCPWWIDHAPIEQLKESILAGKHFLGTNYGRDWIDKRPPLCVCLPDGEHWSPDQKATNGAEGWTVSGEAPNITCSPSIDSGTYHGYLRDGVLTDDLGGRTYQK